MVGCILSSLRKVAEGNGLGGGHMFMACIGGWDEVLAFSEDEEKAKRLAVKEKKRRCKDDLEKWNWQECADYYGAWTEEIKEGTVLCNG